MTLPSTPTLFSQINNILEVERQKMVVGFLNSKVFSSFGQYPLTKEFSNKRITPIRKFFFSVVFTACLLL